MFFLDKLNKQINSEQIKNIRSSTIVSLIQSIIPELYSTRFNTGPLHIRIDQLHQSSIRRKLVTEIQPADPSVRG